MKKTIFSLTISIILTLSVVMLFAGCGDDTPADTSDEQTETSAEETETTEETEAADEPLPKPEEKQASDYTCDEFEELKAMLAEDKKTLLLESNKLSTIRDTMAKRRQQFKVEKLVRSTTKMEEQVTLLTAECK